MEKEEEHSNKNIELAKQFIKSEENWSRLRNKLIGFFEADKDFYDLKRENLVVINGANRTLEKEDDLKNVRHRKDGRWEYRKTINGKKIDIVKRTKTELIKAVQEFKKNSLSKIKEEQKRSNFKNYAKNWFETYKKPNIKSTSAEVYENIINNHLKDLYNFDLKDIHLEDLQKVLNNESGRMKELTYLTIKQIFKQAYFEDLIPKDISQFLSKGKIERAERKNLLYAEQEKLWNSLENKRLHLLIRFYLLTGCRREEARITQKDLYCEENGYYVYINGTKTEKSKRYVKISKRLYDELMAIDGQIFYADYKSVEKKFRKFVKSLGLQITIHQLRHTFATNLYILGVPDKKRQLYLGHSSVVMTNDVYTHNDPTLTAKKIKMLYGEWLPEF